MGDYPDPDEEFELMYGDELELLNEQDPDPDDIFDQPPKSRKSLDFGPSTSSSQAIGLARKQLPPETQASFEDEFTSFEPQSQTVLIQSAQNSDIPSSQPATSQEVNAENRKRTVEDLFGDVDDLGDIFFDEERPSSKRQKKDELEEDLELIEHILLLRKLAKEKHDIGLLKKNTTITNTDRDKQNISYRVPKYPFVPITRFDNERIYVRFHSEEFEKEEMERLVKECTFTGVMGDYFKEVWREANDIINKQIDEPQQSNETQDDISIIEPVDNSKQLWVDLYKPKRYIELLSDEGTNRIMLRWIKLWDKVVFNRKPKIKTNKPDEKKNFFKMPDLNTELNEDGRPHQKVALLCGPPGLGKTTLAHMVARHAGYNVVEINASDDRSTEAFKTALENATQMRSVVDREGRPNCLVFDEIDGAPQASIDFLVKFISGQVTTKAKKGKEKKQSVLKRPIVCICNDVYVPALRPLRQIAFVVNFPSISSTRLAERLMEIARRERIKTDLGAMIALAEKSNNDIRSCLSILHFFKVQNKPVTLSDIYKTNVGQKDVQKGLFSVWQEIFTIEKPIEKADMQSSSPNYTSLKVRMAKILETVSSFGDYEKLAQGVYENFLSLKVKDPSNRAACIALDWFVFSDLLNKQIHTLQIYDLAAYLPFAFVMWHFLFATVQRQKVNMPSAGYEAKQKEILKRSLVSEVLRGMQPSARVYCNRISLVLDILPLLAIIILPPFRPVSLHLYTKEEKENMLRVVNVMIDYNLNYVQERTQDGVYVYNLEPNIEEVVVFDNQNKRRALSYSNKQLISREIELEKLRRCETAKTRDQDKEKVTDNFKKQDRQTKDNDSQLPNHLQKLQVKKVDVSKASVRRDFFGRTIEKVTGKAGPKIGNDIWYQYKEGYNNAVRKRIKISSLK